MAILFNNFSGSFTHSQNRYLFRWGFRKSQETQENEKLNQPTTNQHKKLNQPTNQPTKQPTAFSFAPLCQRIGFFTQRRLCWQSTSFSCRCSCPWRSCGPCRTWPPALPSVPPPAWPAPPVSSSPPPGSAAGTLPAECSHPPSSGPVWSEVKAVAAWRAQGRVAGGSRSGCGRGVHIGWEGKRKQKKG